MEHIPKFYTKVVLKYIAIAALIFLVYYLRNVLLPFAIAFLVAYLLNPVVVFFQKFTKKRVPAVILSLVAVLCLTSGVVALLIPVCSDEIAHVSALIQKLAVDNNWNHLPAFLGDFFENLLKDPNVKNIINGGGLEKLGETFLPQITDLFSQTINAVLGILGFAIIILYMIFIMIDFDNLNDGWKKLIPPKYKSTVIKFTSRFQIEMHRYFRGQVTIAAIVSVLYAVGFWIIGLPMGIMLGILIGILNLVPYLQVLGFLPAALLAIAGAAESDTSVWIFIMLTASVFVVVQIIQDLFLTPKIMGKNTGLNPAVILLSLSIWGKLLGFLGLILALPFTCLVKTYYSEFFIYKNKETENSPKSDVTLPAPDDILKPRKS